ncbi:hypothetical protein RB195_001262 [Necator americanus]|uniref:Uncharacterized protein n=1 Tax=Necator americanus TaxID=51031 RepID=A0ABR1DDH4_NECAM
MPLCITFIVSEKAFDSVESLSLGQLGGPYTVHRAESEKTMFMRNGWISDAPFTLNGISDCTCYGNEHDARPDPQAGQKETSGMGSAQEHRGCSGEDQEHPAACSLL